jgi:uncharacterized protein
MKFGLSNAVIQKISPYTIDLSIFADISDPDMVEHIERVGTIFYSRDQVISENIQN